MKNPRCSAVVLATVFALTGALTGCGGDDADGGADIDYSAIDTETLGIDNVDDLSAECKNLAFIASSVVTADGTINVGDLKAAAAAIDGEIGEHAVTFVDVITSVADGDEFDEEAAMSLFSDADLSAANDAIEAYVNENCWE